MTLLLLGLILFLGAHSVGIVASPWRDRIAMQRPAGWRIGYSVVSLAGLSLTGIGFSMARLDPSVIYVAPGWLRDVGFWLTLFVFPLFLATYLPGRIQDRIRHPTLAATKIWAFAHLLSNGALHEILLFGGFLAWAVTSMISARRRIPRPLPRAPRTRYNDLICIVGGILLSVAFVHGLHLALFGRAVAPPFSL